MSEFNQSWIALWTFIGAVAQTTSCVTLMFLVFCVRQFMEQEARWIPPNTGLEKKDYDEIFSD
jgi:hypothetical protein